MGERRPGGMGQPPNHMNEKQEITFTVPAAKCGIIIGRGEFNALQFMSKSGLNFD